MGIEETKEIIEIEEKAKAVIHYITILQRKNKQLEKDLTQTILFSQKRREEIERLKEENKILKDALLFIFRDYKVDEIDIEELKRALKELKGIDKDEK